MAMQAVASDGDRLECGEIGIECKSADVLPVTMVGIYRISSVSKECGW